MKSHGIYLVCSCFTVAILLNFFCPSLDANDNAIIPIPQTVKYNSLRHQLGKKLFHDTRLSGDNSISCASCHNLENFGVDGNQFSPGVEGSLGSRNTPTIFNLKFNESYFWDGRAHNLKTQIDGPIHNPKEMKSNWKDIVKKLKADADYVKEFKKAYPSDEISEKTIKDAIVEFEKALITPDSPFDKYLRGDKKALNSKQKKGYELFKSFGCISCHQGKNIGGNMLQIFGVAEKIPDKTFGKDKGRFNVTKDEDDKHVYRVPSLRNINETAPYFHNGSVNNLKEAIRIMAKYQLGEKIKQKDINYIYEFLKTLTGKPKNIE